MEYNACGHTATSSDVIRVALELATERGISLVFVAGALGADVRAFGSLVDSSWELTNTQVNSLAHLLGMSANELVLTAATIDDDGSGEQTCPFCGGSPNKIECYQDTTVYRSHRYSAVFGCSKCSARVIGVGEYTALAWDSAIKLWNKRAE